KMKKNPVLCNLRYFLAAGISLIVFVQTALAQITPDTDGVVYVNINVSSGDSTGNSWENAVPELADALIAAYDNTAIHQIWVAQGTYAPLYSAGSDGMAPSLYFGSPYGGP